MLKTDKLLNDQINNLFGNKYGLIKKDGLYTSWVMPDEYIRQSIFLYDFSHNHVVFGGKGFYIGIVDDDIQICLEKPSITFDLDKKRDWKRLEAHTDKIMEEYVEVKKKFIKYRKKQQILNIGVKEL